MATVAAPETGGSIVQNVTIGSLHTLTCGFRGYPPPNVSWTLNGQPVTRGAFVADQTQTTSSTGEVTTTSHLSFTPHSVRFSGDYRCIAAETVPHTTEFQIRVQGTDRNKTMQIPKYIFDLSLSCSSSSYHGGACGTKSWADINNRRVLCGVWNPPSSSDLEARGHQGYW